MTGKAVRWGPLAAILFCVLLASKADGAPLNAVLPTSTPSVLRQLIDDKLAGRGPSDLSRLYNVKAFGAIGDGIAADGAAIQRALDAMTAGGVLYFPTGKYLFNRTLTVTVNNVVMWGVGAQLVATNEDDQAVWVEGTNSAIIGFELIGIGVQRSQKLKTVKILLRGDRNQAVENVISGGKSGGIETYRAKKFRIHRNTIEETLADGVHINWASSEGEVTNNIIKNTGDDMIAVVSFGSENLVDGILIADNYVSQGPWGRGIAIIGGRNITVRNNIISDIAHAAGIRIARELQYKTAGVSNILVENNIIKHIQTRGKLLAKAMGRRTRQGAVDIYAIEDSDSDFLVQDIVVRNNIISDVIGDGVLVSGPAACRIQVVGNVFGGVRGEALRIAGRRCPTASVVCGGNIMNGKPIKPVACQKN